MEQITLAEVWGWIAAVLAAIVLISNAAEKIVQAVKVAKAPNDQQNERLNALEEWREEVDRKLVRDNDRLKDIDSGNRVTQRALLALLDHGIDGNNIKQMQDAKEALQDHLINHN
ncbi:MAG: hypothetical protein J6L72_02275 [Butyricicoccus sp.]|nr:hypothetical protein [Butyricicoccus sp.]